MGSVRRVSTPTTSNRQPNDTKVSKPALGRGLADLIDGTRTPSAPPTTPQPQEAQQKSLDKGFATILHGARKEPVLETPSPLLQSRPAPVAPPTTPKPEVLNTRLERPLITTRALVLADILLLTLAALITSSRSHSFGLPEVLVCLISVGLGCFCSIAATTNSDAADPQDPHSSPGRTAPPSARSNPSQRPPNPLPTIRRI